MGNRSSRDQWAGRERLTFIERNAWWRGVVNRGDLREVFGISAAQASADLQGYLELNPGSLAYNLSTKRYEARPEMTCMLHHPRLDEAVRMFMGVPVVEPHGLNDARVEIFVPPVRKPSAEVERRAFLAVEQKRTLRIFYDSLKSGEEKWRTISPHALAQDGYRWHLRAWCHENAGYRDFALSRIKQADWPGESQQPLDPDLDWQTFVTLRLTPNRDLSEGGQRVIAIDYGMVDGVVEVRVRKAMLNYVRFHLGLPVIGEDGLALPGHLEEANSPTDRC